MLDPTAGEVEERLQVGPGRYCSPRHRMPFKLIDEGSKRLPTTWPAISARPYLEIVLDDPVANALCGRRRFLLLREVRAQDAAVREGIESASKTSKQYEARKPAV